MGAERRQMQGGGPRTGYVIHRYPPRAHPRGSNLSRDADTAARAPLRSTQTLPWNTPGLLPAAGCRPSADLHPPAGAAYNDRVVGTPALTAERAASCPLRVRPAHRAQVCAGGGAGAVGSWPRRRGRPPGRQRVHPPVASARQSRAPALGRPAPSLPSDGA